MKKCFKILILSVSILLVALLLFFLFFWCEKVQRRCTMYDLDEIDNLEDIAFYRWLNEKCASGRQCWYKKLELDLKKLICRYQFKGHVERSKDLETLLPDTYNPCPELYTLEELNDWIEK